MSSIGEDPARVGARARARTVTMSRCTRADFDEILAKLDAFWGSADPHRLETIRHLHHPMFVEELGDLALVVREDGHVVAYLLGFVVAAKRLAYVHLVAVRRDHQRSGLATRLYRHFMDAARARGCACIKAITSPSNRESIAFHARLGMEAIGEAGPDGIAVVPDYSGPGVHRVVMVGDLVPRRRATSARRRRVAAGTRK